MMVRVVNAQREAPVSAARVRRLARCVVRRLKIRGPGELAITLIDTRRMRAVNRRFRRHDRATDVLSFRYDGPSTRPGGLARDVAPRDTPVGLHERILGEILIAPREARRYARQHGVPYAQELSRYVIHGLLHWMGHDDRTPAQQRRMRHQEDRLLKSCGAMPDPRSPIPDSRF